MLRKLPRLVAASAALVSLTALAACGEASTRQNTDDASTTTAAPVTELAEIPAGITLRVADQYSYLETLLELSGLAEDLPYEVTYANFTTGTQINQAISANEIDLGFMGTTPVLLAQAGKQDMSVIAGWTAQGSLYGIISGADDPVDEWADLKGKSIALTKGTTAEGALLLGLDSAGLTYDDVTLIDIPQAQIISAVQAGSADTGVSLDPLTSILLASDDSVVEGLVADSLPDSSYFVVAPSRVLDDDGMNAAVADYLTRLAKAFEIVASKPDIMATDVYGPNYGLDADAAAAIVARIGGAEFIEIPGELAEPQQRLADLFFETGSLPVELDTSKVYDTRFNELIATAKTEAGETTGQ